MPIAIDPREPYDYILECDRDQPEEAQTTFQLRVLTLGDMSALEDSLFRLDSASGEARLLTGSHAVKVLKMGLVGWQGFCTADGTAVAFDTKRVGRTGGARDEVTDECLERLHPDWRRELANAITEHARLDEGERKN